jgi:LysM repeat protein
MNLYRALIAALVIGSGSLLAACGERPDVSTPAAAPGDRPSARAPITAHIVVQRGQSLRRITQEYHVEERDIIAANHLAPPYTLKPGTFLTITVAAPRAEEPKQASIEAARTARAPGKADHESASAKPARRTTVKRSVPDDAIPLDGPAAQTTTMPAAAGPRASPQPGDADADQASRR